MKRIMIIGVAPGVGKSTFAGRLGQALGIDVYHLDQCFWQPGWVQALPEQFAEAQRDLVRKESWIIEGNYSSTFNIRVERADAIIYLELPLIVCLYRVIKRWLNNRGKTRSDMGRDCVEKIDLDFIWFIIKTYRKHKIHLVNDLRMYEKCKQIIVLKGYDEVEAFLRDIQRREKR